MLFLLLLLPPLLLLQPLMLLLLLQGSPLANDGLYFSTTFVMYDKRYF